MAEKNIGTLIKSFWKLFKGYWNSEEKWKARGLLFVVIVMNLAMVAIEVRLVHWNGEFFNLLENRDAESFWPTISEFVILAAIFTLVATYVVYLTKMLHIKWRTWMTEKYLDKWMKNQAYYRIQVSGGKTDNPDQRISEDIEKFVAITMELLGGITRRLTSLVAFAAVLWELSGAIEIFGVEISGYMVWCCLIYAVVGTFLTHIIGRELIPLNFDQQRYEADFRFAMMRVRENSESIAFYGGEEVEKKNVISNYWKLMRRNKILDFYTNSYWQVGNIAPIFIATPKFFSGAIQFGGLMEIIAAFEQLKNSLVYFVVAYESLAELASVTRRLSEFTDSMEKAVSIKTEVEQIKIADEKFSAENLQVELPNGQTLLQDCYFELTQGMRILITGGSGCGKSTLLRTISGIWPFGKGKIFSSGKAGKLFLSQRPYLPLGNLRQAICYPLAEEISDEKIKEVMRLADLEKFIGRLDEVDDWSRILSLGEQQRIAFARVLLFKPNWIFLDESTSALDEPREKIMYDLIRKNLPSAGIVSVGHRSTLFSLHDKELHLNNGNWQLKKI